MDSITLQTAIFWKCKVCDFENFGRLKRFSGPEEDQEKCFRKFSELEDWQKLPDDWKLFEMLVIPEEVTCGSCFEIYSVNAPEGMEDWDDTT